MVKLVLAKKEAVELFGSEDCKRHFLKYGKFTNKDIEISLINEMKRYYDTVESVKPAKGRGYVYELSGEKDEPTPKEDGRISNGAWSNPYIKNMDIMVVSVLEQGLVEETAQTLSKWCFDFGLISLKIYELLPAKYNQHFKEQCLQELKENNIISEGEDRILNDFIYQLKTLQSQLAGTLKRMQKANLIEYYSVPKGYVEEDDKTINLHESTVKKILTLQRELMERYNVSDWYLNTFYNSSRSREYRDEWKKGLALITDENENIIGLSYWYKTYAIILKARKKKIIHYLEKYNMGVIEQFKKDTQVFIEENENKFHKNRHDYVVSEAQKREDNFLSEKIKVIELDKSVKEIYDSNTREVKYYNKRQDYTYDEKYYALYFDRLYTQRIKELQEYYGHTFK
ncbi:MULTISPECIES: hypothetical protein [Lysinibacillus]|uniref:hypothetical protein n=1 Tax=Lysinibacillus TaxID=400634 RepID=UPI00214C428E|nr:MULTISPECIES: hypothetical protein [Lysinibacillus]UUV26026.1 hypothetical protein NP781_05245 [Lysinibacillus sp. FN11]UYB48898.1 hypothetical protein OCI51_08030 [Lysinibacillus capsici]